MNKKDILRSFSKVHNRRLRLLEQDEEMELTPDEQSLEQRKGEAIGLLTAANWMQTGAVWVAEINGKKYTFYPESGIPPLEDPLAASPPPEETSMDAAPSVGAPVEEAVPISEAKKYSPAKIIGPSFGSQHAEAVKGFINNGKLELQDLAENRTGKAKDPAQGLINLIGSLVGDYKSNTQKKEEARIEAGAMLDRMDDEVFKDDQEREKVRLNLQSIAQNAPLIWQSMSEEQQEAYSNSFDNFKKYLVGDRQESFESKLLSPKLSLHLQDGEWQSRTATANSAQSVRISKSLKDLTDLLVRDTVPEEECSELLKDFAIHLGQPRLIISPKGDGGNRHSALSFEDSKRTLTNMVRVAANKCKGGKTEESDKLVPVVRVRTADSGDGSNDNAIRGFMFEEILEVFSLLKARPPGTATQDYEIYLQRKTTKIVERLQRLKMSSEEWVQMKDRAGMDPEQVELIQSIHDIVQGMGETLGDFEPLSLFGSMMEHSKLALEGRRPAFIFPVGTETKRGKRQDVLEVYRTREEAIAAAQAMGVELEPQEHFSLDEALKGAEGVVREGGGVVSLSQILEDNGAFTPGQPVYTIKVSLKNYKRLEGEGALMGGGRRTTISDLGRVAKGGNFSEPFMRKIAEIAGIEDAKSFRRYALDFDKIEKTINKLGDEAKSRVIASKGRLVTTIRKNSLLLQIVNDELEKKGIDLQADAKGLQEMLNSIKQESKETPSGSDALFSKAKEYVKRFLQKKKLDQDLKGSNPKKKRLAQQVIATTMLHGGGSDDDELMCDYRGLNNNEKYVFKQNDVFREAWGSVLEGDGNWELIPSDGGYHLRLASDKNVVIRLNYGIHATKSEGEVSSWYSAANVTLGTKALRYFNKYRRNTSESKVSEAFNHIMLALSLLQEKVSVANL